MKPLIISIFGHPIAKNIADTYRLKYGEIDYRKFPDGESYIRLKEQVKDKNVILLDSLDHPDQKILPLLFIARIIKELGGNQVGLCATYLAYMRQDSIFNPGEGISAKYFANLLSENFDWLVTVDPHLHRYNDLGELYVIPNTAVHAAKDISVWIKANVNMPLLIGPDNESEQWVATVARGADAPYIVLDKIRHGDKNVEVSLPSINDYRNYTPVLVDDIISTARTMIETVKHLHELKMRSPVCIGVHAIFSGNAYQDLLHAGVDRIVTCNTISHESNQIDVSRLVYEGICQLTGGNST